PLSLHDALPIYGLLPPAPFTRMSHVPNLSLIPLLAASTEVLSVTSQLMPTASPPSLLISSATASQFLRVRPRIATFAPAPARSLQKWEPSTPPPPVTTAVFPERSVLFMSLPPDNLMLNC